MAKVKWGVIGAGGIADRRTIPEGIVPAKNAELVAVMDVVPAVAKKIGKKYEVPFYTKEADLLKHPGIDAVYIATPAYLHAKQVLTAAEKGKHILCEKPLALNVADCKKAIAACAKKKVKLGVDFMMRFNAMNTNFRRMVSKGELGTPVLARAQLSCWYPPIKGAWRQDLKKGGGGSLIDMGCHCIDLLEYIFDSKVKEMSCMTGRLVQKYPVEDSSVMMVRFSNGAIGVVDAYFSIPDNSSMNILELYGSKGSIIAKGTIGQGPDGEATAYLEKSTKGYDAQQARSSSSKKNLAVKGANTYLSQIEGFSKAVLTGKPLPIPGEDGLWSQRLMLAAYASAKSGKVVKP
ncbi:MAG: Gfo/Idh/MocA family oxidoreductase [Candidatus Ratteibacteria bacterium]|jgi:predicted dehydrogenase